MCTIISEAQEVVVPLSQNAVYSQSGIQTYQSKKQRAILPFIDDFSYDGPYPDLSLWLDSGAYINNTMSATPITRGVATLDGLNKFGRPYYTDQNASGLADSLTSVPIDLSSYAPTDNIYLSYFYQPQGLGFAPENKDSLFLYFKNSSNQWIRVWETRGTTLQPFKYVILPVTNAQYLHANFQFRFINIASLNTNDDIWNLDYIKLNANRSINDTSINDVAFSVDPTSILLNYTSMPYRHFIANQANEKSTTQKVEIKNNYSLPQNVTPSLNATEFISGTVVNTQTLPASPVPGKLSTQQNFLSYLISYVAPTNQSKVVIRNQYYYPPVNGTDRKHNDTIVNDAVFDNYFAYDDGTAEKSYFLLGATNFPTKTALKFTLNEADTMRGLMVHFGAQAPSALGKYFSIVLYQSLGTGSISDSIILQEDLFQVKYEPSYNGFSSYAFSVPPVLSAGTYYIGITQPANFGSDSIYYGLDVNTNANLQHLAYNVDGTWFTSTINGSIMMRPVVGQEFVPTAVSSVVQPSINEIELYPNPVPELLHLHSSKSYVQCQVYSLDGRLISKALIHHQTIDLSHLRAGDYILVFTDDKGQSTSKKINKL